MGFKFVKNSIKDRCCNCFKLLSDSSGSGFERKEKTTISRIDQTTSFEKEIGIVEAVTVIFEGLLVMNKTRIHPKENISLCHDCLHIVEELYRNYGEFTERAVPSSYFRKLFPNCIPWSSTRTENQELINGDVKAQESHLPDSNPSEVLLTESEIKVEEHEVGCKLYLEDEMGIENVALSDNENYDNDNDEADNSLSLCLSTVIPSTHNHPPRKVKRDPNAVQLANGKWFLPKNGKVVLHRYIPGESLSLDIGRYGNDLLGKQITVSHDAVLNIPSHRIPFYRYRKGKLSRLGCFKKTCKSCNEEFDKKMIYVSHRRECKQINQRKELTCDECGKEFMSKNHLYEHARRVHPAENTHICITCGKGFSSVTHLKAHVKNVHTKSREERKQFYKAQYQKSKNKVPQKRIAKSWAERNPDEIDKATCKFCNKVFSTPFAKEAHVLNVHKPESERPFVCSSCPKRFATKFFLQNHEKIHTGSLRHTCKQCGKSLCTRFKLKRHIENVHTDARIFACGQCDKIFKTVAYLKNHKLLTHEIKEKAHECDICPAKFKTQGYLHLHKKNTHSEKIHQCPSCGVIVRTERYLEKHMMKSHGVNAVVVCDICQNGFATIGEYENHMAKGIHIKPIWMRPKSKRRPRNYNVPSYIIPKVRCKVEVENRKREKEGLPPLSEAEKQNLFLEAGLTKDMISENGDISKIKLKKGRKRKVANKGEDQNLVAEDVFSDLKNSDDEYFL